MKWPCPVWILAVVTGLLALSAARAESEYFATDLGTLGGARSEVLGLNDRGQAVGWSLDADGRTQAFLWQNGAMAGLGFFPGGTSSVALAVNNNGDATGYAAVTATNAHAFLYISNSLVDIGTLGGPNSWGRAINDRGQIAGSSQLVTNRPNLTDPETFLWQTNRFIHVPSYIDYSSCDGFGLNEDGRICGVTFLWATDSRYWGFVWQDTNANETADTGEMAVLGSKGVIYTVGSFSEARAINDLGQVVGSTAITNVSRPRHAFLVTPVNGQWKSPAGDPNPTNLYMRDLGTLAGGTNSSYANAINNRGWVVGTSTTGSGTNQAFLWRNGVLLDLNSLIPPASGWVLTNATAINEVNEIAGNGLFNGQPRAFILRQDGRIIDVDPIFETNQVWVYTNEASEVLTQEELRVVTQIIQWAGVWSTNASATNTFTVEYCDALQNHVWQPFYPTSQWPTAGNLWTNGDFGAVSMRFFRVRAQTESSPGR